MKQIGWFLSLLIVFYTVPVLAEEKVEDLSESTRPAVIGWVETVKVFPGGFSLKARIDTGAKGSSINAPRVESFEKNGEPWVRFDLTNASGKRKIQIERKVERLVKIKRKGQRAKERKVIRLGICLGDRFEELEMSLADRRGFNYPVLIGRLDLEKRFGVWIDPGVKHTLSPICDIQLEGEDRVLKK